MNAITRTGAAGSMLTAALTSLILLLAGPATALTNERTYLPPFDEAFADLSGCDAPWCAGATSAHPGGALSAEIDVVGAGIGRSDLALASVKLTHTVHEPASEVSIDLSVHVDAASASAIGAPFAQSGAKVALEAWPTKASGSYQYVEEVVAGAESPVGHSEADHQDLVLSVTLGEGPRVIPAGPIEITVFLLAQTTTMPPHVAALGSADGCTSSCVGVGSVEATISGEARSVTVKEIR
jgi:hypothetical protein